MEKTVLTEPGAISAASPRATPITNGVPLVPPTAAPAPAIPAAPASPSTSWLTQVLYSLVLLVTLGGVACAWVLSAHLKVGLIAVAVAVLAAALARLVLPERWLGLLATRHRVIDVLILLSLGAGLLAVLLVLPTRA